MVAGLERSQLFWETTGYEFDDLFLGAQSHFRISSLCVCARVPFVL